MTQGTTKSLVSALWLAVLGQAANLGIIMACWFIVALTMGYGAGLVSFPLLSYLPMIIVFVIGWVLKKRAMIWSLPIALAIFAIPATLHRLSISKEFNQVRDVEGFEKPSSFASPNEVIIIRHTWTNKQLDQDWIHDSKLDRIVLANVNSDSYIGVPASNDATFNMSNYDLIEYVKIPSTECKLLEREWWRADETPCIRLQKATFPLPKSAIADFRWKSEKVQNFEIAFGELLSSPPDTSFEFRKVLSHGTRSKWFLAYQAFPRFDINGLSHSRHGANAPVWQAVPTPIGQILAESPIVDPMVFVETLFPAEPRRGDLDITALEKQERYPFNTVDRSGEKAAKFLDQNSTDIVSERINRYFDAIDQSMEIDQEQARKLKDDLLSVSHRLCMNGYFSESTAHEAGYYTAAHKTEEPCSKILPETYRAAFDAGKLFGTLKLNKSNAIEALRDRLHNHDSAGETTSGCDLNSLDRPKVCFVNHTRAGQKFDNHISIDVDRLFSRNIDGHYINYGRASISSLSGSRKSLPSNDPILDRREAPFLTFHTPQELEALRTLSESSDIVFELILENDISIVHRLTNRERLQLRRTLYHHDERVALQAEWVHLRNLPLSAFEE